MKHIKLLGLAVLSLSCISATVPLNDEPPVPGSVIHYVDFFNNFNRQEFTLSNGTTGKGNNMIFKTIEVYGEHPIAKPEDSIQRLLAKQVRDHLIVFAGTVFCEAR